MSSNMKALVAPVYRKLRWYIWWLLGLVPTMTVEPLRSRLVRLGTGYGGWCFVEFPGLKGAIIVSCGLGEDASFDVEFAARFGATVLIVDPTPRAVIHYTGIKSRIGLPAEVPYTSRGAQPLIAYDLSKISHAQLLLCEKALWNEETTLRFFAPSNPSHVSHSIVNFQNRYSDSSAHIEVQAITMKVLLEEYGIADLRLLKLDIEGAEIEVILDLLEKGIRPDQILVEFDELSVPSRRSKKRVGSAHSALLAAGYALVHRDEINFTYVLRQLLKDRALDTGKSL